MSLDPAEPAAALVMTIFPLSGHVVPWYRVTNVFPIMLVVICAPCDGMRPLS